LIGKPNKVRHSNHIVFSRIKTIYIMSKNPHEKAPLSALMVEKRSGNSEKFGEEKLVRGISRAGTPFLLAKDISKSITSKDTQKSPLDNFIYSSKTENISQKN
jgi:transcriptional regulator NrdR family protein